MSHFERIHKSKAGHRYYDDEQDHPYREAHHGKHIFDTGLIRPVLKRIIQNKALITVAAGVLISLLVAAVALVVMILPYAYQFVTSIEQNGIKNMFDSILPFIKKLWEGTGSV
jgi:hypothetical protein